MAEKKICGAELRYGLRGPVTYVCVDELTEDHQQHHAADGTWWFSPREAPVHNHPPVPRITSYRIGGWWA